MSSSSSSSSASGSSKAIAIPKRKKKELVSGSVGSSSSSASSSSSFRYEGFGRVASNGSPVGAQRRESLMSATFSKADYTVINVGEEERPRLITCVKASQGFDWNQEIFLPSYADYPFDDLECRQDPVEDIIVTDEEIKTMFPS